MKPSNLTVDPFTVSEATAEPFTYNVVNTLFNCSEPAVLETSKVNDETLIAFPCVEVKLAPNNVTFLEPTANLVLPKPSFLVTFNEESSTFTLTPEIEPIPESNESSFETYLLI